MLTVFIQSYDAHFDTFACNFTTDDTTFDSLIPATMMPYVAPEQCAECEDLPYDLVGKTFTMSLPTTL
jgi:hypothetical protein